MYLAEKNQIRDSHYNPQTGRFLSEDPIGFNSGDYNLYRYVHNNPLDSVDPTGLRNLTANEILLIAAISGALAVSYITYKYDLDNLQDIDRQLNELFSSNSNSCGPGGEDANALKIAALSEQRKIAEVNVRKSRAEYEDRVRRQQNYVNQLLGLGVSQYEIEKYI